MSGLGHLLERFLADIDSRLNELGEMVASLRRSGDIEETVRRLGRALHTIKGESRLLGLEQVTQLCHLGEDVLFSHHRAGDISEQCELALYETVDTIFACIQAVRQQQQMPAEDLEDVVTRLQASIVESGNEPAAQGESIQSGGEPPRKNKRPEEDAAPSPPRETGEPREDEAPTSEEQATAEAGSQLQSRPAGESMRGVHLSSAQIDQLTNLVSGISGSLVRNRQYIDRLVELTTETQEALVAAGGSDIRRRPAEGHEEVDVRRFVEELLTSLHSFREHAFRLGLSYSELADLVRDARIQPLRTIFGQYQSFARRLARPLGKRVRVTISGEELGLDQRVLAEIAEPCLHLLKNSIHHGIETEEERRAKGKPEEGTIAIHAEQDGDYVRIDFSDDGAGINLDSVRQKAVALGLVDRAEIQSISDDEISKLIFSSGLSTASEVSEMAGRGVGLDVVETVIANMGGTVKLTSTEAGGGTCFSFIVPLSLSLARALLIEAAGQVFAVPSAAVVEVFRLSVKEIQTVDGRETTSYRGKLLPLVRLREALGLRGITDIFVNKVGVLVLRADDQIAGFVVDRFMGEREIVIRPMGEYLGRPRMASGLTVVEDGSVVTVLHVPDLLSSIHKDSGRRMARVAQQSASSTEQRLLYAEDSVITREYAAGIMRASGFDVTEAGDGLEALELLRKAKYDLLLTDLQMPRMDGFKLVAAIRRDPDLRHLPVVVLSTLDTPETKRMALDAGADAYMVKAEFAAGTLLNTIKQVLR